MGSTRYKVTYKCDCGCDYGSCGKRSIFLFEYNRSCDTGTLSHKIHADDPDSKMEFLGSYGDDALSALIKVLTESVPSESWDEEDKKDFEQMDVIGALPVDYWKRRCALAEECLKKSPCDPDITKEQIEAWAAYHSFIKEFGNDKNEKL